MPIIRSSIKKMRQDKKREAHNKQIKDKLKRLIKNMRRSPNPKFLQTTESFLDKAAKVNLIHPNKAARLKSRLAKLIGKPKTQPAKAIKKTPKNAKS